MEIGVPRLGKVNEYRVMTYPWPIPEPDYEMQIALDVALNYLEQTGQAYPFSEAQRTCTAVILKSWREGTRHRIKLANDAINAIERKEKPPNEMPWSFYPRAS